MKERVHTCKLVTLVGELYWSRILQQYIAIPKVFYPSLSNFAYAGGSPNMHVTNWAWYADGTESGSNIIGSVNTNPTTLETNTTYLIRHGVQEIDGNSARDAEANLFFNKDAAGFVAVGAATACHHFDTANLTDDNDTTQRITSFTFHSTNNGVADLDNIAGGKNTDLVSNGFESLHAIRFNAAGSYVLRVRDKDDADFGTYDQTDTTVTVSAGSTPETVTLDKATMAVFVAQDIALHETVVMEKATFAQWIGQAVETSNPITEELAVAVMQPFVGQTVALAETIVMATATMQSWIGYVLTVSGADVVTLAKATWAAFVGRAVDAIQSENLILDTAVLKQWLGQSLTVIQATFLTLATATTVWVGKAITVTSTGVANVYNIIKPLTKTLLRKMNFDTHDKNKDHQP